MLGRGSRFDFNLLTDGLDMTHLGFHILPALLCLTASAVCGAAAPAPAPANDRVERLLDRIVENEQAFLARMQQYSPVLETYIQEVVEDRQSSEPFVRDHYMIGKLDIAGDLEHNGFFASAGFRKSDTTVFYAAGFAQMVIPDAYEFDRRTYHFEYARREFIGDVRALVFDVEPRDRSATGKFIGRVWVDDQDYNIIRFNGTYTMSKAASLFFHFDSWRVNVAPGEWVPAYVYIEDGGKAVAKKGPEMRFRAQTRLWGYMPVHKNKLEELTDILIEAESEVKDDDKSKHISPVERRRIWARQAADNVTRRLETSGLLAPVGEVDEVLNTVLNNLLVTNNINIDVYSRVLLTTPLETFSVGEAILVSRGLIDVLPDEASLAAVLAAELAHIILGHGTETMWAFSDRTMFDDTEVLREFDFTRRPDQIEAANEKALEMLRKSPYADKLSQAGLFLKALAARAASLPHLTRPNLGNALIEGGRLVRLAALADEAPELDAGKLDQIAALPLGSRVRLDPWSSRLTLIKAKPVALRTAEDKLPFEVTPFVIHLTRAQPAGEPKQGSALGAPNARERPVRAAAGAADEGR